jgi:hypothetical protein
MTASIDTRGLRHVAVVETPGEWLGVRSTAGRALLGVFMQVFAGIGVGRVVGALGSVGRFRVVPSRDALFQVPWRVHGGERPHAGVTRLAWGTPATPCRGTPRPARPLHDILQDALERSSRRATP